MEGGGSTRTSSVSPTGCHLLQSRRLPREPHVSARREDKGAAVSVPGEKAKRDSNELVMNDFSYRLKKGAPPRRGEREACPSLERKKWERWRRTSSDLASLGHMSCINCKDSRAHRGPVVTGLTHHTRQGQFHNGRLTSLPLEILFCSARFRFASSRTAGTSSPRPMGEGNLTHRTRQALNYREKSCFSPAES